jgi:hypothetical protein
MVSGCQRGASGWLVDEEENQAARSSFVQKKR